MKNKFFTLFLSLFSLGASAQAYLDDIMLQSFGWDEYTQTRNTSEGGLYGFYTNHAGELKAAGFDMVWLPPASKSTGGVGYFPTEWYNFSQTSWGTEAQLTKMLSTLNANGINPIADIVVNHRSGSTNWTDFTNPTWGCETIVNNDEATYSYYNDKTYVGCLPSGAADTGDGFGGSRDLDHTNATVQNGVIEYLGKLKAMGFKGWRWDVAKGFAPQYFEKYITASAPYYSVGEYWDSNPEVLKNWINGTASTSGAFDFATYYKLSETFVTSQEKQKDGVTPVQSATNQYSALNVGGAMAGLAGQYGYADKAVTFVDNHDTFVHPSAFVKSVDILKAYTYILTHPGIPCVFAPHYYGGTYTKDGITRTYSTSNKATIDKLMSVRKTNGINAYSSITIDRAEAGLYAAYIKKTSTDAEPVVAMKIGPYDWTPAGTGWNLVVTNTEYKVWSKSVVNVAPTVNITPASSSFTVGATQSVTMTATDDSATAPKIYYTLDGSTPTAASTLYTAPFSVNATTTVKAVSIDDMGLSSGVVERTYTFASGLTIRFKPPVGWTSPKIHYWGLLPAGTMADANWSTPVSMSADPANVGWFTFSFPGINQANFLFRSGASTETVGKTQSGDILNVTANSCYIWDATSASPYVKAVDCSTLGTNEVVADQNAVSISLLENPVQNGEARLKYTNAKGGNLNIYDFSGKLVKSVRTTSDKGEQNVSVQNLKGGMYIIQLKTDKGNAVTKMMIK